MADTQQGVRQQSARNIAGTTGTYDEDLRARFNAVATVPAGSTFNEAFILWLQATTGSSADNINDLAAEYAAQQNDVYNWSSSPEGSLPVLFRWYPEDVATLPGTATFTRADGAQVLTTTDGTTFWNQEAQPGEIRFEGERRVENLTDDVNTWTAQNGGSMSNNVLTFAAQGLSGIRDDYNDFTRSNRVVCLAAKISHVSGPDQFTFRAVQVGVAAVSSSDLTATSTPQIFQFVVQLGLVEGTGFQFILANGSGNNEGVFNVEWAHLELLQDSSDVFGGEVLPATIYNAEVAAVRYFNTTNGNTVSANPGVVTEAAGATITGGGYLAEPEAENHLLNSSDLTAASWNKRGTCTSTALGITDIGLPTTRLSGVQVAANNDCFQSLSNNSFPVDLAPSLWLRRVSTTGVLQINNSQGLGFGDMTVDFAAIGSDWVYITEDSPLVTVIAPWSGNASDNGGIQFRGSVGGPLTFDVAGCGCENTAFPTSVIITGASSVTRVADSLTDGNWTAESSALVDATVKANGGAQANLLGFGSASTNFFALTSSTACQIKNGGITATATAATSLETERHQFAFSLQNNDGIVVNDESNSGTDNTGTVSQGTAYIGSASDLSGAPVLMHTVTIYTVTQTLAQLQAAVA